MENFLYVQAYEAVRKANNEKQNKLAKKQKGIKVTEPSINQNRKNRNLKNPEIIKPKLPNNKAPLNFVISEPEDANSNPRNTNLKKIKPIQNENTSIIPNNLEQVQNENTSSIITNSEQISNENSLTINIDPEQTQNENHIEKENTPDTIILDSECNIPNSSDNIIKQNENQQKISIAEPQNAPCTNPRHFREFIVQNIPKDDPRDISVIIHENDPAYIVGYRGEACVYEALMKEKRFTKVIWNALSDDENLSKVTTVDNQTYYIKEDGEHYDLYAEDENGEKYYFEVKSTDANEKDLELKPRQIELAQKLSGPDEHHYTVCVFNVHTNPLPIFYKKVNNFLESI